MKAILIDKDKNLVWSKVPYPTLTDDGVIIKVYAAALNRADILQRQGKYPSPEGWPEWMGLEVSGEIVEIGSLAKSGRFSIGDKVCALLGGGGYAEFVAVPIGLIMPIPKNLTMEQAASLPEAFATSYLNLFIEGHMQKGQIAYIPAGASGLASAAIPLAKAFGAKVITSVLTKDAARAIEPLCADTVIVGGAKDAVSVFKYQEEQGSPVNVAMDCLSGEALGECMQYMARGGYWIVISTLDGITTQVQLRPLLTKGLHLVGSMLRNRTNTEKEYILNELVNKVWSKIESGEIKPYISKVLPITEAEEAHKLLESGRNTGKVVLKVIGAE